MAGNVTGLHRFADDVGPVPLSLLDTNFDALTLAINTLNTYSNFYVDTGTTNALTITPPSTQSVNYGDGLIVSVRVAATNTGASTLNIGTLGPQPIQTASGAALPAGVLQAGAITDFIYNAARNAWQLKPGGGGSGGGAGGPVTAPFTVQDTASGNLLSVQQPPLSGSGIVTIAPGNISNTTPNAGIGLLIDCSVNSPGLVVAGATNTQPSNYVAHFNAPSAAPGLSNGVWIAAGTNNSDTCFVLENAASADNPTNAKQFMIVHGDGSGALGPYPNQLIWNAAGTFSLTGTATLPGGGTGGGVSYLSQLLDVSLTSQTNGQALTWNSTTSRWTNTTLSQALAGLTDVAISASTNNQVLTWNTATSRWINQTLPPAGSTTLAGLTDVTLTGLAAGQFLSWNGNHWINVAAPSGGGGGGSGVAPFTVSDPVTTANPFFAVPSAGGATVYAPHGSAGQSFLVEGAVNPQGTGTAPGFVMQVAGGTVTTANQWLLGLINYTANAGCSNGLLIESGINASDSPLTIQNQAKTSTFFVIHGDGTGTLGASANNMTWTANGFTFTSTSAAVAPLTIVAPPATTPGIWLWDIGGSGTPTGASPGCSNGLLINAGTTANDSSLLVQKDGGVPTYFQIKGDGSGTLGPAPNQLVWTAAGAVRRYSPATTQGFWKIQIGGGASGDATDCSNGIYIGAGTSANDSPLFVQNDAGTTTFLEILGNGAVSMPAVGTTTTIAANVAMDTAHNNNILVNTSSARFKRDIETVASGRARETIRRLRTVSYRSRCLADDPSRTSYGLIAEEVAEVDPNLVTLDSSGLPLGVQYERIAMLLLPLVQELLEARP